MGDDSRPKKTVLMVTFWFPPTNLMPSVRMSKMAKYLPNYGWEPVVLTVDRVKRNIPATMPVGIDESKIERTSYWSFADFLIYRMTNKGEQSAGNNQESSSSKNALYTWLVTKLRPFYHLPTVKLFLTDPIGWYFAAVKRGLQIIQRRKIDVIFSSYGPSTSHFVAHRLHQKTGIPWVADFRDFWSMEPNYPKTQPFQWLEEKIERRIIKGSCLLTTVSEPWANQLEAFHQKETVTITNAFDADDFAQKVPLTPKFTLTHTGHLQHWDRQQIPQLFQAVAELKEEGRVKKENFEIRFFGEDIFKTEENIALSLAKQTGIQDLVSVQGYIPFKESIRKQQESVALLLSRDNNPVSLGVFSGKIFEYLGAGRPILAMALKNDVIDNLLAESGSGKVVNEKDEIKNLLVQWLSEYQKDKRIKTYYSPKLEVINKYSYGAKAEKLANVFNKVITNLS